MSVTLEHVTRSIDGVPAIRDVSLTLAGLAAQSLLAQPARVVAQAGIEGGGGAANDVLGGVLAHARHIRTKERPCNRRLRRSNRPSGEASNLQIPRSARDSPMCNCTSEVRADARPGTTLVSYCAA